MSQEQQLLRKWHFSSLGKSHRATRSFVPQLGRRLPGPRQVPPALGTSSEFGVDHVPSPARLCVLDPTTSPILTFSGIYDVGLDFDHCLSS